MSGLRWREYPRSVLFILGNEFCERFSFYGMKALLTVYLITEHGFTGSTAVLLYHTFTCLAYLSPLFGSILADSYLGRYSVILYVSILYVIGHCLLSFGAVPWLDRGARSIFDFSGLFVIAIGTGGIKPCVSAFAVDQFPEEKKELRAQFFSFFYFAINAGALLAIFITPIFKSQVSCFGSDHCFPLAFGVPGLLMLIALLVFAVGTPFYRRLPPCRNNVGWQLVNCIFTALSRYLKGERQADGESVLQLAAPKYNAKQILAVQSFLKLMLLFSPLAFFWALFDQKGSTWILLARQLNGRFGPVNILAEQINVLNPFLILLMIPFFESILYPVLNKCFKLTPLRKIAIGGFLTALSFALMALLQIHVTNNNPVSLQTNEAAIIDMNEESGVRFIRTDDDLHSFKNYKGERGGFGFLLNENGVILRYAYEKPPSGISRIHLVVEKESTDESIFLMTTSNDVLVKKPLISGEIIDVKRKFWSPHDFVLSWGRNCTGSDCPNKSSLPAVEQGSVHAAVIDGGTMKNKVLIPENGVSLAWLIPHYVIITTGEVFLSVTGLELAYSQTDSSMKSLAQALWLWTVFFGNLIDIAISGSHIVKNPAWEFLLYAVLMCLVMIVFVLISVRYKYVDHVEDSEEENKEKIPLRDRN